MKYARSAALRRQQRGVAALALCTLAFSGQAMELDSGNPELKLRWDNSLKFSTAYRLKAADPALLISANADDGDRNFGKGPVSQRLDLLSEFDAQYRQFGFRLSAAAWYDRSYQRTNDNNNPATANHTPANEFSAEARRLHGRKAEIMDAFFAINDKLGDTSYTVRLGQHSMTWGETLFFGNNGIAGLMMPFDIVKAASVPNTQVKELVRPVPMLSGQVQVTPSVTLGAYYQVNWQASRLPAAGTYFSTGEITQGGSEPWYFVGSHLADRKASGRGQGGLQLRLRDDETDYGFYFVRAHAKTYQPVVVLGPGFVPTGYRLDYQEGIRSLGVSASRTFGDVNLAAEMSARHGQDLASSHSVDTSAVLAGSALPAYAVGNTLHFNTSMLWSLPRTALFSEASLTAELAWNRVLKVTNNPVVAGSTALDPHATRSALAMRLVFEPMFRAVGDGVDLSIPLGLGWAPGGSRSMASGPFAMPVNATGDLSLGAQFSVRDKWYLGLGYTHYLGRTGLATDPVTGRFTYQQALKDRDFLSLSLRTAF